VTLPVSRIRLYGVAPVDLTTAADTVDWIDQVLKRGQRARIVTLNATGLMMADRDLSFRRYVEQAERVVADGQPLVWASKLFGQPLPERVAGIDLIERIASLAAQYGFGIFLLGARTDTVASAASELQRRHPGLVIAGHHHGFIGDDPSGAVDQIVRSGANILLVGMGSPRQEQFLDKHWEQLDVGIAMGVGGSFEVLADQVRRAPRWAQRIGLEWVFRMAQEPRRLTSRYLATFWWLTRRTAAAMTARPPRP
jgi:N-acetylglucosaminyldiphosphoundecaprenol N-acetyl-beta-D-mannosaminyltransferase